MDYKKLYDYLMAVAVERNGRPASIHSRKKGFAGHHVIPFCLWPGADQLLRRDKSFLGNDPSNLVYLTHREHYVAHLLLAKIHGGLLSLAVIKMREMPHQDLPLILNGKMYKRFREEGQLARVNHPNTQASLRNRGTPVIGRHKITGKLSFFPSAISTKAYGFSVGNVVECCNQKGGRTQHKGYIFRWATPEEIEAKDATEWSEPNMGESVTFFTGQSTSVDAVIVCAGTAGLKAIGVHHSSVCGQIAGKGRRKSVGGYVWRYSTQKEIDLFNQALLHKHRGYVNISQPNIGDLHENHHSA